MSNRYLLTIVGEDRPGIVAAVSQALYLGGCNLGQASMIRLAGSFSIMMVVGHPSASGDEVVAMLEAPAAAMKLTVHLAGAAAPAEEEPLHAQLDARVRVFGADRPGIVAEATSALAAAGLNILHLESAVAGGTNQRIYVMTIEGQATRGVEPLREAVARVAGGGVEATVEPIEPLLG